MITPVQNKIMLTNASVLHPSNNKQQTVKSSDGVKTADFPYFHYPISFGHKDNDTHSIQTYLNKRQQKLIKDDVTYESLSANDLKNIEGIQKGIKLFENLTMPQIAFLASNLTEVVLQRGCNNMCAHCYAEAMPPSYQKSENKINKIDFEDFENFCNGFKELNKRLGFNIFKESENDYNTLFHDADSSMMFLSDKNGETRDYLDLAKMLNDTTGKTVLFDTAGWNIQDKKTQQRIEKLVDKAINSNDYSFMEFNVSANPFHAIYNRSVKHRLENNPEKERKFKDIYTSRMANVLFTLSPLISENRLKLISRALPNGIKNAQGYTQNDLRELYEEIFRKLKLLYQKDFVNDKKVIKKEEQIIEYTKYLSDAFSNIETNPAVNGRLANIVTDKKSSVYRNSKNEEYNNPIKAAKYFENGLIDVNGKFYVTNWYETYQTDIQLNYKNKDKITAPISPNLRKQKITKDMLNKINV